MSKKPDLHIDFWYDDTFSDIAFITCQFYDLDCIYRGNIFNSDKKIIGDYHATNSTLIQRAFNYDFGGNENVEC